MEELVIFGVGGHAREVAQLVTDINQAQPGRWNLLGFVADPHAVTSIAKPLPAPVLGDASALARFPRARLIVAVGDPADRRLVVSRLHQSRPELRFATLVHPRAWLAERVSLGEGSVVFAGALINIDVTIGSHASLNLGCTISHDCVLGNFVSLGPGVHLSGACVLGEQVDVGTGVSARPRSHVGDRCVVGAGAAIAGSFSPGCTLVGVPARPVRKASTITAV